MSVNVKHMVIFSPVVRWPLHFETDLELARLHLDLGGKVTFLQCRGNLPVCAQNIEHQRTICYRCQTRFAMGMRWLGSAQVTVKDFYYITDSDQKKLDKLMYSSCTSIDELRRKTIDDADVGLGALGSVISAIREPNPDYKKYCKLLTAHLKSAAIAYLSVTNHLRIMSPDIFVLFNGRFAELRGALQAAQRMGTHTYVHERSGRLDRYSLTLNTYPLDIPVIKKEIEELYCLSELSCPEKATLADEWYQERRENKDQSWYSFTKHQQRGRLPELSSDRCNLAIFLSSEDELEAFDDWRNPFYLNQADGLRRILSDLGKGTLFRIILRVHPNLAKINNSQTQSIDELKVFFPELIVIPADSLVNSYELVDACDVVLTFGSTIGIESVFAGKPSILVGRAFYEDLKCCIKPDSHFCLINILESYAKGNRDMIPLESDKRDGVVKYGYFNKTWGKEYKYVKPIHVGKSLMVYNGKETWLRASILSWLLDKSRHLFFRQ